MTTRTTPQKIIDNLELHDETLPHKDLHAVWIENMEELKAMGLDKHKFKHICYWYNYTVAKIAIETGASMPYYQIGKLRCGRVKRSESRWKYKHIRYINEDHKYDQRLFIGHLYFINFTMMRMNRNISDSDYKLRFKANKFRRKEFSKIATDIEDGKRKNIYANVGMKLKKLYI